MKKKNLYNGGGRDSLHSLRRLRTALAEARRERETERKKALLCSIQRDFYGSLVGYLDEYFVIAAKTEEQFRETKQHYQSFAEKRKQEYTEEAKPLIEALYTNKAGRYYAKNFCEPYYRLSHERMRLTKATKRRTIKTT